MTRIRIGSLLVAIVVTGGCAVEGDLGSGAVELVVENGKNLNGKNLNGKNLNGSTLGTAILWTSFEGIKPHGGAILDSAWIEGTELVGLDGASVVRGMDFEQAEFQAVSDTGTTLRLRAKHVTPPASSGEPWRYWVEYLETDNNWYPTCLDGTTWVPSIAINGWWNPEEGVPGGGGKVNDSTKFTFACPPGGAIGKCIGIGYEPWATVAGTSLDGHHQACVRALRADYCGDGTSYTTDGKVINLYDGLGIQLDTEDWKIEAEWDGAGARCFSTNNRALDTVPCFKERATSGCGKLSNFDSGTLLMSEMP